VAKEKVGLGGKWCMGRRWGWGEDVAQEEDDLRGKDGIEERIGWGEERGKDGVKERMEWGENMSLGWTMACEKVGPRKRWGLRRR